MKAYKKYFNSKNKNVNYCCVAIFLLYLYLRKIKLKLYLVALYGTGIQYDSCHDRSKIGPIGNCLYLLKKIFSVVFASFIFLVEEMQNVFVFYKEGEKIILLAKKQDNFKQLSQD